MLVRGRCLCFHRGAGRVAVSVWLARFRSLLAVHDGGQPDCRSFGGSWRSDYLLSFRATSSEMMIEAEQLRALRVMKTLTRFGIQRILIGWAIFGSGLGLI